MAVRIWPLTAIRVSKTRIILLKLLQITEYPRTKIDHFFKKKNNFVGINPVSIILLVCLRFTFAVPLFHVPLHGFDAPFFPFKKNTLWMEWLSRLSVITLVHVSNANLGNRFPVPHLDLSFQSQFSVIFIFFCQLGKQ